MKKTLSLIMTLLATITLASCGTTEMNEETPLILSSQELDGVFNPFFASSAPDTQIVGMTQMGMLGNNKLGEVTTFKSNGDAVVVYDYEIVEDKDDDTTTYYLAIRNDIKFSNGSPLTIKDVLFNLYVYLDPVYTGSSTIYSTDIVGLNEYRTQQADEEEQERFMEQFQIAAETRTDYLLTAAEEIYDDYEDETLSIEEFKEELELYVKDEGYENVVKDFEKVCEFFKEELEEDYKNSGDGQYKTVTFKNDKNVTYSNLLSTDVEMFLLNEGYLWWNKKESKLESSLTNNVMELKNWSKETAINTIYADKLPMSLAEVALFWNTSVKFNDYLINASLEQYHEENERTYTNISGIKFANRNNEVKVNGKSYEVPTYNEDGSVANDTMEVLSITINGVDPKAIWNFAFTVAPMYYYSSQEYIDAFDYEKNFGVEYSSQEFMNNVVRNPEKIGVPVGAGPYKVCNEKKETENVGPGDFYSHNVAYFVRNDYYVYDGKAPEIKYVNYQVVASSGLLNALYNGEVDYVQPNSNPDTIAELQAKKSEGIESKSITTSGYGYIGVNAGLVPDMEVRQAIMHSIDTSMTVSYYGNTASAIYRSLSLTSWAYPKGATPYYPYVGAPIPEDLDVVNPYYAEFVEDRGYKTGDVMSEADQKDFIIELVEEAGYIVGGDGVYVNGNNKLKFTFTIAGAETDHPAFNAFYKAAELLNKINFDVTVSTDSQALRKLSSGSLAVWAAAWSSTIDPDMYQVYHKDSTATSTLNWGYKQIKQNTGGKYNEELALVEELSEIIELARETNDQDERARYYSEALDLVMQLAVELPTYQRDDLFAYNANKIDVSTLNQDTSPYSGLLADLHKVRLNLDK